MSITIIKPKNHEEWLNVRQSGIGSSEIATIVGLNPFETPYQLWRRKLGIDPPKQETFAMKAGHYLEDAIAKFWQDASGREVIKSSAGDWIVRNNETPYIQVSPDRTFWLNEGKHNARDWKSKGILECKSTQKNIDRDDLPKHWFCQVQWQLGGSELEQGSLAWLVAGRQFDYIDLMFVPDFFGWLKEQAEKFWTDNIVGKKEPEAVSVDDIVAKYSVHTDGKQIEVGDDIFEVYSDLRNLKDEIAVLEERKTELEGKLKMAFGDAESISYGGATLATWKAPKATKKFNAKWFCESNPALADEFSEEVQGARRFLLK